MQKKAKVGNKNNMTNEWRTILNKNILCYYSSIGYGVLPSSETPTQKTLIWGKSKSSFLDPFSSRHSLHICKLYWPEKNTIPSHHTMLSYRWLRTLPHTGKARVIPSPCSECMASASLTPKCWRSGSISRRRLLRGTTARLVRWSEGEIVGWWWWKFKKLLVVRKKVSEWSFY